MAEVVIYTKSYCPYCKNCKEFLEAKGVSYSEMLVDDDPAMKQEMVTKSGRPDAPQVFVNGHHVGSFDDLKALDATGKLDGMLDL